MKRLLVLMLVLGIASTASAGLSFSSSGATVSISGTTTVSLLVDSASVGAAAVDNTVGNMDGSIATLSSPAQGSAVNTGWSVTAKTGTYVGYFQIVAGTSVGGGYVLDDEISILTLTGDAVGTYTIYVFDASWTSPPGPTDSFVLTVIPEPMTIGLLGLGGLFLRRRK